MIYKKGTIFHVRHQRKGEFRGIAERDFDTEKEEFYPIALAQEKAVRGMSDMWEAGESVPCRGSFCILEVESEP